MAGLRSEQWDFDMMHFSIHSHIWKNPGLGKTKKNAAFGI